MLCPSDAPAARALFQFPPEGERFEVLPFGEGLLGTPPRPLLQFRPEREGRRGGRFANRPYGRCRRVPRGWRTSTICGGCEGAPHLSLLPWGDLCVTLGGRLWQGRADPTSPRPHPNPLPAGEGADLPALPVSQPAGGLCKGRQRRGGRPRPGPLAVSSRGGKAGGEGDSRIAPTGGADGCREGGGLR